MTDQPPTPQPVPSQDAPAAAMTAEDIITAKPAGIAQPSFMQMPSCDAVNHPKHYNAHPSGVECIAITEHMNFCIGNAFKYLWRADHKNGVEDLKKAIWYIQRRIAMLEKAGHE